MHLVVLKYKLNFERSESNFEWVLILDKLYNQLVLFM
jgi:hypothetical protein